MELYDHTELARARQLEFQCAFRKAELAGLMRNRVAPLRRRWFGLLRPLQPSAQLRGRTSFQREA